MIIVSYIERRIGGRFVVIWLDLGNPSWRKIVVGKKRSLGIYSTAVFLIARRRCERTGKGTVSASIVREGASASEMGKKKSTSVEDDARLKAFTLRRILYTANFLCLVRFQFNFQ